MLLSVSYPCKDTHNISEIQRQIINLYAEKVVPSRYDYTDNDTGVFCRADGVQQDYIAQGDKRDFLSR